MYADRDRSDALASNGLAPGKQTLVQQMPEGAAVQRKTARAADPVMAPTSGAGAHRGDSLDAVFSSGAAVQRKASEDPASLPAAGAPTSGGSALPPDVQSKMERSFGADFAGVRIHEGPEAKAIGALAYTQGTDIHFDPGQYDPSSAGGQQLLGHELAHVVQQAQGRVSATTQKKGVAINDDSSLEHEADQMGARAARGEPAHGGGIAGPAAAAPISQLSIRPYVQLHKTLPENKIPVQTDGNCGLFSIISSLRAFGFSEDVQAKATTAFDTMVEQSDDTFLGELFTVDLMLQVINDLQIDGEQILKGEAVTFTSQEKLEEVLTTYKEKDNVTLLIGYSKPDEYDKYYRLRGEHLESGTLKDPEVGNALEDKLDVESFKVKDAHWGMINEVSNDGFVDISDSIAPLSPNKDHGYNTLMSTRKLFNSNMSLSNGEFDWSNYIDQSNDSIDYNTMNKDPKTKDLSNNQRYQDLQSNNMKEKLDLSGKLVVVTVTEQGTELLKG